ARSAATGHGPVEERYADTETDADARGASGGITSLGATDQNADTAILPSDQPGVRRGDTDAPAEYHQENTASSEHSRSEVSSPTSPSPGASNATLDDHRG